MGEMDCSSWKSYDFSDFLNGSLAVEIVYQDYWVNEDGHYGLQDLFYQEERPGNPITEDEEVE